MGEFNINMSIEDILNKMNDNKGMTETIHAGPCFLQYKLNQKLLQDQEKKHKEFLELQNNYNHKQLFWSRLLVIGTWALVIATLLLTHNNL